MILEKKMPAPTEKKFDHLALKTALQKICSYYLNNATNKNSKTSEAIRTLEEFVKQDLSAYSFSYTCQLIFQHPKLSVLEIHLTNAIQSFDVFSADYYFQQMQLLKQPIYASSYNIVTATKAMIQSNTNELARNISEEDKRSTHEYINKFIVKKEEFIELSEKNQSGNNNDTTSKNDYLFLFNKMIASSNNNNNSAHNDETTQSSDEDTNNDEPPSLPTGPQTPRKANAVALNNLESTNNSTIILFNNSPHNNNDPSNNEPDQLQRSSKQNNSPSDLKQDDSDDFELPVHAHKDKASAQKTDVNHEPTTPTLLSVQQHSKFAPTNFNSKTCVHLIQTIMEEAKAQHLETFPASTTTSVFAMFTNTHTKGRMCNQRVLEEINNISVDDLAKPIRAIILMLAALSKGGETARFIMISSMQQNFVSLSDIQKHMLMNNCSATSPEVYCEYATDSAMDIMKKKLGELLHELYGNDPDKKPNDAAITAIGKALQKPGTDKDGKIKWPDMPTDPTKSSSVALAQ